MGRGPILEGGARGLLLDPLASALSSFRFAIPFPVLLIIYMMADLHPEILPEANHQYVQ